MRRGRRLIEGGEHRPQTTDHRPQTTDPGQEIMGAAGDGKTTTGRDGKELRDEL